MNAIHTRKKFVRPAVGTVDAGTSEPALLLVVATAAGVAGRGHVADASAQDDVTDRDLMLGRYQP